MNCRIGSCRAAACSFSLPSLITCHTWVKGWFQTERTSPHASAPSDSVRKSFDFRNLQQNKEKSIHPFVSKGSFKNPPIAVIVELASLSFSWLSVFLPNEQLSPVFARKCTEVSLYSFHKCYFSFWNYLSPVSGEKKGNMNFFFQESWQYIVRIWHVKMQFKGEKLLSASILAPNAADRLTGTLATGSL